MHTVKLKRVADVTERPPYLWKLFKLGVKAAEKPVLHTSSEKARRNTPGKQRLVSFTLIPEKIMECVLLEAITGHMKDRMMTGTR